MECTFTRTTNQVQINSFIDKQPGEYQVEADALNNILTVKKADGGYSAQINLGDDTVTVNGDVFSGTAEELKTLLYDDVFCDAEGSSSPGGGLALESYQNSAMSVAVDCFVYRDSSLAIWKVYEPTRNNTVSRTQFAYADSIDLFPFDSVTCFNNNLYDVKLVDIGADFIFQDCNLQAIVVKTNNTTGNKLLIVNWFGGGYGTFTNNDAEIYFTGNGGYIERTTVFGKFSFIDSVGANSYVSAVTMLNDTQSIYFNDSENASIAAGLMWENGSQIRCYFDGFNFYDFQLGGASKIYLGEGNDQFGLVIGDFAEIGSPTARYLSIQNLKVSNGSRLKPNNDNLASVDNIEAGLNLGLITTTGNVSNAQYLNIAGSKCILGVSGGNVTATPV